MFEHERRYVFRGVYEYAALVESCCDHLDTFFELGLEDDAALAKRLFKPNKLSILAEYAFAMIRIEQSRSYRKSSGEYDDEYARNLESSFHEYSIEIVPFCSFDHDDLCQGFQDPFAGWFALQEDAFIEYWSKITDEVFHLLFANRGFLLRFGTSLAEYLSSCTGSLPDEILSKKGSIRRAGYIPSWLKKAVFYRDHGRCVSCRKDLTGLLATDHRVNFDHIVPLAKWGTNDPSNFQLTCEACNLKKSDSPGWAGTQYIAWWDY